MDIKQQIKDFLSFFSKLKGDEKGEAQPFCDRLFRAFGHDGIFEAGGALEARIKFHTGKTKFVDCLWSPPGRSGVLIEMKKRAEVNLENHFPQARDYWMEMKPEREIGPGSRKPRYVILCNFDKFIIYDELTKVDEFKTTELPERWTALKFLLPEEEEPVFGINTKEISKKAARQIGELFKYLVEDKEQPRETAQRFVLQCVVALFSDKFGLLPEEGFFHSLIRDCLKKPNDSYDLIGGLFRQMASPRRADGGRFAKVVYFNGGLFEDVKPIELDKKALEILRDASLENWKKVNPSIFGSLFEGTMNKKERHNYGAHYTFEVDIYKIVYPTIIKPWNEKIKRAGTRKELLELRDELSRFQVLDPACGCGNFLFIAYLALKDIEMKIIEKIAGEFERTKKLQLGMSVVSTKQFWGIDILPIAVEIAKMTMMLAKEIAWERWGDRISPLLGKIGSSDEPRLPLDNLDDHFFCRDAILEDWPEFDVVIGNPPFQSKNKMKQEMDVTYIENIKKHYPEIPGRADYCVYWLRKTHDLLKEGQRAGLVGTNTIRQNYSREGGLDYIIKHGGTITDAVSTQEWSGEAAVHVSIVNWIKGNESGEKTLSMQQFNQPDSPFKYCHPKTINSALALTVDLSSAKPLAVNEDSHCCYQGQTHGHKGFLLPRAKAEAMIQEHPEYAEILFPFLIGDELLKNIDSLPSRYVIDFRKCDCFKAATYQQLHEIVRRKVYADKKAKAEKEPPSKDHENAFKTWWQLFRPRGRLIDLLETHSRYIACSRVTKFPIFEFIHTQIHPNDALQIFPMEDDYSFGILQSSLHWLWFTARCSTHEERPRYTSNTVFDSFPWPQKPTGEQIAKIAKLAVELRLKRREIMVKYGYSLRKLYQMMDATPKNPVSSIQKKLDMAVCEAYGFKKNADYLQCLLDLNLKLYEKQQNGQFVQGPGFPTGVADVKKFITEDSIKIEF